MGLAEGHCHLPRLLPSRTLSNLDPGRHAIAGLVRPAAQAQVRVPESITLSSTSIDGLRDSSGNQICSSREIQAENSTEFQGVRLFSVIIYLSDCHLPNACVEIQSSAALRFLFFSSIHCEKYFKD